MFFFSEFAEPYQKLFQNPATPMMNGIIDLHHYIFMYLIAILIFVLFILFVIIVHFIFFFDLDYLEPDACNNKYKVYFYMMKNRFYHILKASYFYVMDTSKNNYFDISRNRRRKKKPKFFAKRDKNDISHLFSKMVAFNFVRIVGTEVFWNNFWTYMDVATLAYNNYTKRFRLMDDIMLTPPSPDFIVANWSIPTLEDEKNENEIQNEDENHSENEYAHECEYYHIGLIESTIDNKKSETTLQPFLNLRTEGAFVTSLYLRLSHYNNSYPLPIILEAKQIYGGRFEPKAYRESPDFFMEYILCYTGYELTCVYNPYIVNLMFWTQVYTAIKSGLYRFTHNTFIEIVWTIIPSLILVFIGVPSFILLYAMDEIIEPDFIVKCIGHQWYWSYEVEYVVDVDNNDYLFSMLQNDVGCFYVPNKDEINIFYPLLPIQEEFFNMFCSIYDIIEDEIDDLAIDYEDDIYFTDEELDELDAEFSDADLQEEERLFLNLVVTALATDEISYEEAYNKSHNISLCNKHNIQNINGTEELFLNFSSYMINEADLQKGNLRLLEVDNPLYLPVKTHIDLLITANDVLHSWTIPSFGVKCDAVPGRLNHSNLFIERPGVFYGQCSEICGVNHGFMPIKVVVENPVKFSTRFISGIL